MNQHDKTAGEKESSLPLKRILKYINTTHL